MASRSSSREFDSIVALHTQALLVEGRICDATLLCNVETVWSESPFSYVMK